MVAFFSRFCGAILVQLGAPGDALKVGIGAEDSLEPVKHDIDFRGSLVPHSQNGGTCFIEAGLSALLPVLLDLENVLYDPIRNFLLMLMENEHGFQGGSLSEVVTNLLGKVFGSVPNDTNPNEIFPDGTFVQRFDGNKWWYAKVLSYQAAVGHQKAYYQLDKNRQVSSDLLRSAVELFDHGLIVQPLWLHDIQNVIQNPVQFDQEVDAFQDKMHLLIKSGEVQTAAFSANFKNIPEKPATHAMVMQQMKIYPGYHGKPPVTGSVKSMEKRSKVQIVAKNSHGKSNTNPTYDISQVACNHGYWI